MTEGVCWLHDAAGLLHAAVGGAASDYRGEVVQGGRNILLDSTLRGVINLYFTGSQALEKTETKIGSGLSKADIRPHRPCDH